VISSQLPVARRRKGKICCNCGHWGFTKGEFMGENKGFCENLASPRCDYLTFDHETCGFYEAPK